MTTATLNVNEVTEFWRVARRLYAIYAELDQTYELGQPPCAELQDGLDHDQPEVLDRIRQWFDAMDSHIQVWQLRQLLQSTGLQNEENLRYLIVRHLERTEKSESDKEKIDFLLVQYFAHCAPGGIIENQVTLDQVARVLQPALGLMPDSYPDWANALDEKLQRLNQCNSLEDLQNSGALLEVRELKLAVGDQYFEPGLLVAFTRFNFRARRAFFKAMHMDLHAIRSAVNELEQLGHTTLDCREAGLTESESLEQVRHVVHQWKTPFRAPYSGGSSFLQLILLRHSLQHALNEARAQGPKAESKAAAEIVDHDPKEFLEPVSTVAVRQEPELMSVQDVPAQMPSPSSTQRVAISDAPQAEKSRTSSSSAPAPELSEEEEYLQRCV